MLARMLNADSPLTQLQSEMNRLMEHFFEDMPTARPYGASYPAMNVWEDGNSAWIECELPGLTLDDIEVFVSGNDVTVKGNRKIAEPEKAAWHRRERSQGEFVRSITLPWELDAEKVAATFRDGVLTIELPRAESAKPKKVKVLAK
jgi:HSP20 family protein